MSGAAKAAKSTVAGYYSRKGFVSTKRSLFAGAGPRAFGVSKGPGFVGLSPTNNWLSGLLYRYWAMKTVANYARKRRSGKF